MTLEKGRIVNDGMGGFLCPPTHPEHTQSVETDLHRRPDNRGRMSLSGAIDCEWLDPATRAAARRVLDSWQRPALDSEEVRAWIRQVLGYFRGCYCNPIAGERQWHASDMIIDKNRDPLNSPDAYAGVHLIKQYYPDYILTDTDLHNAKWGK